MSRAARTFTSFVGVDLGGGRGKNTAVAVLVPERTGARVRFTGTRTSAGRPFYDEELLDFIAGQGDGALLAIDAPLTPTVCVRCRLPACPGIAKCPDPVVGWFRTTGRALALAGGRSDGKPATTPYTQRACELVMHRRYGIQPREALGQGMGPLTARAHYLRRALEGRYRLGENLIEVYPKATLHALFGPRRAARYKRGADTWAIRAEMLEALSHDLIFDVWREGCLRNDHAFDAVVCAYTGYLWAREGWTLPREDREVFAADGWIWFPGATEG